MNTRFASISLVAALLTCAGASAAVIRVNHAAPPGGDGATWATALNSLQTALALAQPGDEVRVAQGVYKPGGPGSARITAFTIPPSVKVKGGYFAVDTPQEIRNPRTLVTTLSGDFNGDDAPGFANRSDNAWNVVRLSVNDTDPQTLLEGFTIRGGNSDDMWNVNANGAGGLSANNASSTIRDCVFTDNSGISGGAVFIANGGYISNPRPRIERCMFVGNRAMPGTSVSGGGGVCLSNSRAEIVSCVFVGNTSNNRAGAIASSGPPDICDNRVINCTIVANYASGGAGGVYNNHSRISVVNSILWGNTSDSGAGWTAEQQQFLGDGAGRVSAIRSSTVQGLGEWAGSGNSSFDPLLVDPDGADNVPGTPDDNVRLSGSSPAWNAGDSSELPPGATRDIAGNARVWAGQVDMGAYERDSFPPGCPADFDGDGQVTSSDLATLLGTWGVTVEPPMGIVTDLDGNNTINASDLAILLGSWGVCP